MRPTKRNLRLPTFAMDRHDYATFAALMLVQIEQAAVLGQPFSKSCTLHDCSCLSGQQLYSGQGNLADIRPDDLTPTAKAKTFVRGDTMGNGLRDDIDLRQ